MTQNLTSRRTVAGRFALLAAHSAVATLCLSSIPALAQHGGGHAMGAAHGVPMGERPPSISGNRGTFGHEAPGQQHMGLQLGLGGRWWDDHGTAHKLKLNSDQQHRMDDIFEANKPALITAFTSFQREESNLSNLSHADLQDESKVFAAIDRVSHARADLEKENAHILLQIRQQLDPDQLAALDKQIANLP